MAARLERLLRVHGLEPAEVLGAATETQGLPPQARIAYAAVDEAIERCAERLGAAGLGLELAHMRDDEAYGAAGLLLATSDNLRQGLRRALAYQRLWGDGERFVYRETADGVTITFRHPGASALACAVLAECALVEVLEGARVLVNRDAIPLHVDFAHAPFGGEADLARYFGVAPRFGQAENAITLAHALVDAPLVLRRELLRAAFEQQCRRALGALPDASSIADRVRRMLSDMHERPPGISRIAGRLRMSARTLQRKLGAEGTSFQRLVDAVRRKRAEHLRREGRSNKEVALELGYSDPSGFVRARRRWRRTPGLG